MKTQSILQERFGQWKDGLLSDSEMLSYALEGQATVFHVLAEVTQAMREKEGREGCISWAVREVQQGWMGPFDMHSFWEDLPVRS